MDFRTKIDIPRSKINIEHQTQLIMLGSCFAENMGKILEQNKFLININPFGILYNPESIKQALETLTSDKEFTPNDLFYQNGLYQSFMYHGSFSSQEEKICLTNINRSLKQAREDLIKTKIILITFGTSYVYRVKETKMIVANCHKVPSIEFDRFMLNTQSIADEWNILIQKLNKTNPNLQFIFTVSPIRHFKDGAHQNQLSKSTLLLAIDQLSQTNNNVNYFPSYEIMLDELRDYRFYNEDMTHPSSTAINYIWQQFSETYLSDKTKKIISEWKKIQTAIQHRPLNPNTTENKHFLKQTLLRLKGFNEKYSYICCSEEMKELAHRIDKID